MLDFTIDPFVHLTRLLDEAKARGEPEHNAMTLATCGEDQRPSARIVYMKGFVRGGLAFYTNYDSEKAREIAANSFVCLNFYYPKEWQQMRITGRAEKLTRTENETYFATRARLSQLGAWASQQSSVLPDREHFERRLTEFEKTYEGQSVPCPANWGGYRVVPDEFEFWFGRDGRLHERYCYARTSDGRWNTFLRNP